MFVNFFFEVKKAGLPTSLREYLMLLEAMEAKVIEFSIDDFYYLSRSAMVKDERHIDKFDRVFGHVFKG
ncbi:MAG: VWA domain-containing protein, partial [Pseudomonadota bacterium]|nr:VWA domain-containing protein [Pseudomonadota bacterium]